MGVRSGRGLQINTVYRTLLVRHRMRVLVEWCEREKETPVSNSWIPYAWLNDACKVEARDMCGPACAGHGQQRHRNPNRKHHVLADAQERKVRRGKQPHAEREQKTDLALMLAHSAIAWWGHGSFGARRPCSVGLPGAKLHTYIYGGAQLSCVDTCVEQVTSTDVPECRVHAGAQTSGTSRSAAPRGTTDTRHAPAQRAAAHCEMAP